MRRGEVWWARLDPARPAEADKRRPVVLVSNDAANRTALALGRGTVTVVPVTSNVRVVHPFQVRLLIGEGGLDRESKAQAEQVRSVSVSRLAGRIGELPEVRVRALDEALRLHLGL